ncbi:uncharacterized protein LOC130965613 [Arachis stenosperma]|uniref:uncharacterized protein LOC130965613 n=1 Tax=Arachis stenosperma TaxID=217475 RepID=UPI0025AD5AB6|nr:uncharacterized protein LOC130965613 [Arachis stenosperma]
MIPPQTSLQQLENLILMNIGLVGKKKISNLAYKMPVALASSFAYQKIQIKFDQYVSMMFSYHRSISIIYSVELCVKLQDVGGSSSSSKNVEKIKNFGTPKAIFFLEIGRARSPTFNAFVTSEQNTKNSHGRPSLTTRVASPEGITDGLANTSDEDEIEDDSSEEAEVVPKTQSIYGERVLPTRAESVSVMGVGGVSSSTQGHYLALSLGAMNSTTAENIPSNYDFTGEMELEIDLKFLNRETTMLAVKNYNIRRSAEYNMVESDQTQYVDATICIKVLQGFVESTYGYKVSYKKVWLAKQKSIARIFGDWDDSYNQLRRYFDTLQTFIPENGTAPIIGTNGVIVGQKRKITNVDRVVCLVWNFNEEFFTPLPNIPLVELTLRPQSAAHRLTVNW